MEPARPQPPGPVPGQPVPLRASDADRDAAAGRLQDAFAEGRLDDAEFDGRMRAALTAKTAADLDLVTADLPAAGPGPAPAGGPPPGRFAVALKGPVRRAGRWRVPARFIPVVYKGSGWLDLRAAELTAPVTTLVAVAYKSRIDVLVPPGVRVEMDGFGVSRAWSQREEQEAPVPAGAPVVRIRGVAYKAAIEVATRPPHPAGAGQLTR